MSSGEREARLNEYGRKRTFKDYVSRVHEKSVTGCEGEEELLGEGIG